MPTITEPHPTVTRPAGAVLAGIGLKLLSSPEVVTPNVTVIGTALAFVALPLWAGQQDGGGVEVGEGAFDGMAAWLGRLVGTTIMV